MIHHTRYGKTSTLIANCFDQLSASGKGRRLMRSIFSATTTSPG
jgi:hypothetical protein